MKTIKIHFDGACHNKPRINQPMGVGVAVFIDDELRLPDCIAHHYVLNNTFLGMEVEEGMKRGTSNISEWRGCAMAMEKAYDLLHHYHKEGVKIVVYSDSELITKQFNGEYLIKNGEFLRYEREAKDWAKLCGIKTITWIPREENKEADILSKIGLKQLTDHEYYKKGLPEDRSPYAGDE